MQLFLRVIIFFVEQTGNVAIVTAVFGGATGFFEGNATGIHTLSNIGIGTTTSEFPLTVLLMVMSTFPDTASRINDLGTNYIYYLCW